MTTDENGSVVHAIEALSSLGPIEAVGEMTLKLAYAGSEGDVLQQPLEGASTTHAAYGTVLITITPDEPLPVQSDGSFESMLMVDVEDATQSIHLANLNVDWAATDAAGTETSNGSAEARGNEILINGQGAYDGRLRAIERQPTGALHAKFRRILRIRVCTRLGWKRDQRDQRNQPDHGSNLPRRHAPRNRRLRDGHV